MFGVVGSQMYGWYGSGTRTAKYTNILDPAPEPSIFVPTDISDCALWLDANDGDTIQVNGDLSGANVNRVMKWFDKAKPSNQNYYRHVGNPATSGLYNVHSMNQLNTVYFEPFSIMDHQGGGVTFNFQARTFFYVGKPLTDLTTSASPFLNWYNTSSPGNYMNTGLAYSGGVFNYVMCENGISCGIAFANANNPLNQRQLVMFAQTDQVDLSGNTGSFDTITQTLTSSDPADSYSTGKSQYVLNDSVNGNAQDIAEIIMYGRLLTTAEQIRVLEYLADKWNLSGPTTDSTHLRGVAPGAAQQQAKTLTSFYPTYGYAIYGQYDDGPPNWFWCDENQQLESPPVLIVNYTGSTGDRESQTYTILGSFYAS